jgi:hypothetical protein
VKKSNSSVKKSSSSVKKSTCFSRWNYFFSRWKKSPDKQDLERRRNSLCLKCKVLPVQYSVNVRERVFSFFARVVVVHNIFLVALSFWGNAFSSLFRPPLQP